MFKFQSVCKSNHFVFNDLDGHDWKIQTDVRAVVAKLRRSDVLLRLPLSA